MMTIYVDKLFALYREDLRGNAYIINYYINKNKIFTYIINYKESIVCLEILFYYLHLYIKTFIIYFINIL